MIFFYLLSRISNKVFFACTLSVRAAKETGTTEHPSILLHSCGGASHPRVRGGTSGPRLVAGHNMSTRAEMHLRAEIEMRTQDLTVNHSSTFENHALGGFSLIERRKQRHSVIVLF